MINNEQNSQWLALLRHSYCRDLNPGQTKDTSRYYNALLNIFQVVGYNLGLRTVKKFMRTATLFFSSSVKHNVLSSEFYSICETA